MIDLSYITNRVSALADSVVRLLTLTDRLLQANKRLAEELRILQTRTDNTAMQASLDALATQAENSATEIAQEITAIHSISSSTPN